MVKSHCLSFSLLALFYFVPIPTLAAATSKSKYLASHSMADDYKFDSRDGWQATEATDSYKYPNSTSADQHTVSKRDRHSDTSIGHSIKGAISGVWRGITAFGDPTPCTITWYTGHDLKNPSCWANGDWAPTDESFACATTLHGWHDRPQCLDFIEVCNGPRCTFVRVVDSCAGCTPGSRHIDLTRAAFNALADEDEGRLKVQYRRATEPHSHEWREDWWGPRRQS